MHNTHPQQQESLIGAYGRADASEGMASDAGTTHHTAIGRGLRSGAQHRARQTNQVLLPLMLCAFFWCCIILTFQYVWFGGSFESLVVHLREKETIRIAKAMLQRVHLLCTLRHGSPPRALAPENVNVRVFLAGFMIAFRPTHVFESMGELEGALLNAATPLMEKFQGIIHCLLGKTSSGPSVAPQPLPRHFSEIQHALTDRFPFMLYDYLVRFKAWKAS